jgi:arginine:ornithine antiporter/lysine permease
MVLVTLLPYAVLKRAGIADIRQPSMAGVLEAVVGPWDAVFISVGLLISVLGAYLAWSLTCAEVLSVAAKDQDIPKVFATENKNRVPVAALWMTNIVVQLFVISTYWSQDAFTLMRSMTSVMTLIPFFFVALYGFLLVRRGSSRRSRSSTGASATAGASSTRSRAAPPGALASSSTIASTTPGRWASARRIGAIAFA